MNESDLKSAAQSGLQAVASALEGDVPATVGHALDTALALVPAEDLAPYLTEAGVRRAKAIKEIADAAKFGPLGGT